MSRVVWLERSSQDIKTKILPIYFISDVYAPPPNHTTPHDLTPAYTEVKGDPAKKQYLQK